MSPEWSAASGQLPGEALMRAALVVAGLLLIGPLLRLLLAGASSIPGRVGRLAASAGAAVRPGLLRRLLAVVLGLGVPAVSAFTAAPAASALTADRLGPVRPAPPPRSTTTTPDQRVPTVTVVVAPGDTLWDIARRHLPAGASATDVAHAWPRWYAANRAVIGSDPSMLRPGTRLRSPGHRSAGTPRGMHHRPRTSTGSRSAAASMAQSLDPDRR
jgi:hypothetical protein